MPMSAVCQGEGREVTVNGELSVLLPSLLSAMRLMSSTLARMVCDPAVAVHALEPPGPPLAVTVRDAPAASEAVLVSDQLTGAPSTEKSTPWMTPFGVAPVPWFLIVALNVTAWPAAGFAGDHETAVTTRSGVPEETVNGSESL